MHDWSSPDPPGNRPLLVWRRSGLVREGLRSGPKTGHLGCIWCAEAAGFAAGSRQFADKSAPTGDSGQVKRRPVCSRGLRPESKAGLHVALTAWECSSARSASAFTAQMRLRPPPRCC
ncbi:hypothetical protein BTW15_11590 [Pseudomonas syringae pv. tomato]|uniref:DUF1534 domain-containing protein n=1 Tax=Pseudomonas syringae pv. tomato TaxID=323 RepID=A0AB36KU93_PSEUB|nr:hypothetical protein BTW15_11590 [Pseudomonas syringae pv. tomato]